MLAKTIGEYTDRIKKLETDMAEIGKLFENELSIKDNIIGQVNAVKDAFIEKTKRLIMKLKIPREHYFYL